MRRPDDWEEHVARYKRADDLYRAGELRRAIKEFRAALALAKNDSDTLWALADCHSELGRPYKAERLYRAALARAEWSERGDLLYNIGNALLDQQRPTAALNFYRRVVPKSKAHRLAQKNISVARRMLVGKSVQHGRPAAYGMS